MRIALAQINTTVGDFAGNTRKILRAIDDAKQRRADLVVFPELALCGYYPGDLLLRDDFIDAQRKYLAQIMSHCEGIAAIVGFAERQTAPFSTVGGAGRRCDGATRYNAAAFLADERHCATYRKRTLPSYDVFDEQRHFTSGAAPGVFVHGGRRIGVLICEDVWDDETCSSLISQRLDACVVINASPFSTGKQAERATLLKQRARSLGCPLVYCNLVGANDHVLFEGRSMAVSQDGVLVQAASFREDLILFDLVAVPNRASGLRSEQVAQHFSSDRIADIHDALVMGIRDYARKNGFSDVVLGLSGGIDSAVTCALAASALGPEHVHAFLLPSRYTSERSVRDARAVAQSLGVRLETRSIEDIHEAYEPLELRGVADQNVQARIRMSVLMAQANALGALLLATGNKSELATGYCTLYGDLAGAIAPLGDVFKTDVYALARYINKQRNAERQAQTFAGAIPPSVMKRAPSAELAPGQKDQDTLPAYSILDRVLSYYLIEGLCAQDIVRKGFSAVLVRRVLALAAKAEHKRRQAPIVLRVSEKAFGHGRRVPVTMKH